jgi:antitoxin PrlF
MAEREIIMTMTRKGQVTIPVVVRRLLGLEPNRQVAFVIEAGEVRIQPADVTLQAAYGAVKPLSEPENFEEIARLAQEEHAQEVVGRQG